MSALPSIADVTVIVLKIKVMELKGAIALNAMDALGPFAGLGGAPKAGFAK